MKAEPEGQAPQPLDEADEQLDRLLREAFEPESVVASGPTHDAPLSVRLERRFGPNVDPAVSLVPEDSAGELPNEVVERLRAQGPRGTRYRLLGEVARGGMGVIFKVYDDDLRRTLAMKVVLGRDRGPSAESGDIDPQTLGRFLEEAQVTGQLDHPGILPVHELGLAPDGRVYFTMRLVKGADLRSIFEHVHAGTEGWSQTRALGVLLKVCEAMSYAHDKGVIHRDLKPANVMVGKFGEVYVMDWGLAHVFGRKDNHDVRVEPVAAPARRAQSSRRRTGKGKTDSPLVTKDGDVVGTPVYMPPEQARGRLGQMGPRSDVYSLGAMLYHLLSGAMPYVPEGKHASQHSILMRLIEGPPRPLHEVAPDTPPELAAICERAMAREPADRYADMQALSEDLRAYLEHRVVAAYEVGAWAEARKWVQRNKPLAASMAAAAAILIVGLVVSTTQYVRAEENLEVANANESQAKLNAAQARLEAERANALAITEAEQRSLAETRREEAERARAESETRATELQLVADFQSSMLQRTDVELMGVRLREDVLNESRAALQRAKRDEAEIARHMQQLEALLAGTNFTNAAVSSLERNVLQPALASIDEDFAEQPIVRGKLLIAVGRALNGLGLHESALRPFSDASELAQAQWGADARDTLVVARDVAMSRLALGHLGEAERQTRDLVERSRRTLGDRHPITMLSVADLGEVVQAQGKLQEAESLLRQSWEWAREVHGEDAATTLTAQNNLGVLLHALGRHREAEQLLSDSLERRRRLLRSDHPDAIAAENNLASLLLDLGRPGEAETLQRSALERCRRVFGDSYPHTTTARGNLAEGLRAQGKLGEAESLCREVLEQRRRIQGDDHPETLIAQSNLGGLLREMGQLDEAERLLRTTLQQRRRLLGEDHPDTANSKNLLGDVLDQQGERTEAVRLLREALATALRQVGADHERTRTIQNNLTMLLRDLDQLEEAEVLSRDSFLRERRLMGVDHPDAITAENNYAQVLQALGKLEEAEPLQRDAFARGLRVRGADHLHTLYTQGGLGRLLLIQGKLDEAEPLLRDALDRSRRVYGANHAATVHAELQLARLLIAQSHLADAEVLLLACETRCVGEDATAARTLRSVREALAQLHAAWELQEPGAGHAAKGAAYRAKLSPGAK